MEYFVIIIASIFVNNVVLSQFLGICPFLGVSSRVSTSVGMGAAVTFVMAISSVVAYLIQYYVLVPLHIEYMQTIIFILVIAALVQMVEIVLKKLSPALYQALGIFLPLITTNCAVLGIAILLVQKEYDLGESVVFATATAIGFSLARAVRRFARAARDGRYSRRDERDADRLAHRRHTGYGVHGIFRLGQIALRFRERILLRAQKRIASCAGNILRRICVIFKV